MHLGFLLIVLLVAGIGIDDVSSTPGCCMMARGSFRMCCRSVKGDCDYLCCNCAARCDPKCLPPTYSALMMNVEPQTQFVEVDSNGDGIISADESLLYSTTVMRRTDVDELNSGFALMDVDNDGFIQASEFDNGR